MIGELATTNIPVGATHTISDWFTIKVPNTKTNSGKSTRINNHRSEGAYITYKGYKMDIKNDFEVYNQDGSIYHGPNENNLRAHAWGLHHNLNPNSIWNTPWGNYNPNTEKFVNQQDTVLPQAPEIQDDFFGDQGDDFLEGIAAFTQYGEEMQ
jgi:hypothetical protein